MTVAVSKALEHGASGVVCASTGNTAASAAAYAARAGLDGVILAAGGRGRAREARAGARGRRASSREVRRLVRRGVRARGGARRGRTRVFVNSVNPFRLEGQKTAAFELVEELGGVPDVLALPYGGGGNTTAYALGFREAARALPQFVAVQAAERATRSRRAIRIAEPVHRDEVAAALEQSGGAS